ncbi:Predicted arabinose efflux permease, MFS family [Psychrobacillus sp. OK028]|uniref:MFS transporter n=1 Tax=Psychrobacillus sp. OK028 TaxID=1884359 RepID=UPI00088F6AA5|nr:MFS transporter [Psychrobacillus sp. OK028]SDO12063.1 Predicted arabinose efflux permease, MFS family [Psychrobacillus sp. OK028]
MQEFTMEEKRRFKILVIIVSISGFSQGMLLPLISVIFEQDGVSATLNGLSATGLYIGTLLISPFMEPPLRKFGYKPIIIVGGLLVIVSLMLFPLWKSVAFWFVLRLLIGIGDHALHFSTQTWITSFSPQHRLGRNIAIYGLSFGVGFAVGPLFVQLVEVFEGLPFIISSILCLCAWVLVFFIKNEKPEVISGPASLVGTWKRFGAAFTVAWIAFIPPFSYGFLESSLNAIYPVYALRNALDVTDLSYILAAFSIGGVASQLPLGVLSDRIGRRKVLIFALALGSVTFGIGSMFETSAIIIGSLFFIAGTFVGSTFSLGISYMTDLTPKELLPTGNLLCGIFFSMGSLSGPFLGGLFIQLFEGLSFLILISLLLGSLAIVIFISNPAKKSRLVMK